MHYGNCKSQSVSASAASIPFSNLLSSCAGTTQAAFAALRFAANDWHAMMESTTEKFQARSGKGFKLWHTRVMQHTSHVVISVVNSRFTLGR